MVPLLSSRLVRRPIHQKNSPVLAVCDLAIQPSTSFTIMTATQHYMESTSLFVRPLTHRMGYHSSVELTLVKPTFYFSISLFEIVTYGDGRGSPFDSILCKPYTYRLSHLVPLNASGIREKTCMRSPWLFFHSPPLSPKHEMHHSKHFVFHSSSWLSYGHNILHFFPTTCDLLPLPSSKPLIIRRRHRPLTPSTRLASIGIDSSHWSTWQ